jgi:hypothetical protein
MYFLYFSSCELQTGWITADNASNMDTCVKAVGATIDPDAQMRLEPNQRRIQYVSMKHIYYIVLTRSWSSCMEHAIHLSAKHVAEEIAPTPLSKLAKRIKAVLHCTTDLDTLDQEVERILQASDDAQLDTEDSEDDFSETDLGDALGIALALATQVFVSLTEFKTISNHTCV